MAEVSDGVFVTKAGDESFEADEEVGGSVHVLRDDADVQAGVWAAPEAPTGRTPEVVLPYTEYQELLRLLARHTDWEMLPPHLQDAIDNVLADDALAEGGNPIPLRQALAEPDKPAI